MRLTLVLRTLAGVALTFIATARVAAQNGDPIRECCDPLSSLYNYIGGNELEGSRRFLEYPITLPDGQVAETFLLGGPPSQQKGIANLYKKTAHAWVTDGGANHPYDDYLEPKLPILPGTVLLSYKPDISVDTPSPCSAGSPSWMTDCASGVVDVPGGTESLCLCEFHVLGGPTDLKALHGKFEPMVTQPSASTYPIAYLSNKSGAQLWWHNPGIGNMTSHGEVEVMHTDGTVAHFEVAQAYDFDSGGQTVGKVLRWQLMWVRDPWDNQMTFTYSSQKIDTVTYPSGLVETWHWSPTWAGSGRTGIEVTYSGDPSKEHAWGMHFDGPAHFGSPLYRVYHARSHYVPTPSAGSLYSVGSNSLAFTVIEYAYDTADERVASVKQYRDHATTIGGSGSTSSTETLRTMTFPSGKLASLQENLLGATTTFTYPTTQTRTAGGGVPTLSVFKVTTPGSSKATTFEYDPTTWQIWRVTGAAGSAAVDRPRDAEWPSGGYTPPVEPTSIITDYTFGSACVCQKPTKIEITSGGNTRTTDLEYYATTKLLKSRTIKNPSNPGAGNVTYTYDWVQDSSATSPWTAWRIEKEVTPAGTFEYSYGWESRTTSSRHGSRLTWMTSTAKSVLRQTGLTTTTTTTDLHNTIEFTDVNDVPIGGLVKETYQAVYNATPSQGITKYEYDADGSLSLTESASGTKDSYTVDAWGRIQYLTRNSTAGTSHQAAMTFTTSPDGSVLSMSVTDTSGVLVKSETYYDRWGNTAVVRRKNAPSPSHPAYVAPTGTTRGWVRTDRMYQHGQLLDVYEDRRPLNDNNTGTISGVTKAWMLHTEFGYRPDGRLQSVEKPNGATVNYSIDGYGAFYKTETDDPNSAAEVAGAMVFVNEFLEPVRYTIDTGSELLETKITRNSEGYVTDVQEPSFTAPTGYSGASAGAWRKFTLDTSGRRTAVKTYDSTGTTLLADQVLVYDSLGRAIKVTNYAKDASGAAIDDVVTVWSYGSDASASRLDFIERSGGYKSTFAYTNGRRVSTTDNGSNGSAVAYVAGTDFLFSITRTVQDSTPGTTPNPKSYVTAYTVDNLGRILEIDEQGTSNGSSSILHEFAYNSHGQVDTYTDPLGHVEHYLLDAQGRLAKHSRLGASGASDDIVTTSTFEDFSSAGLSKVLRDDDRGNTTETHYDYVGRPFVQMNPGAGTAPTASNPHRAYAWFLEYDDAGRVTKIHDGDSGETTLHYDGAGRLIQSDVGDVTGNLPISNFNVKDKFERDALGRINDMVSYYQNPGPTNYPSVTEAFDQDSLGRIYQESFSYAFSSGSLNVDSAYPTSELYRSSVDYLNGTTGLLEVDTGRDSLGRIDDIDWKRASTVEELADYTWHGATRRTRDLVHSSTVTGDSEWTYDLWGRLDTLTHKVTKPGTGTSTIQDFDYTLDAAGNLVQEFYMKVGSGKGDRFVHDAHDRLYRAVLGADNTTMGMSDAAILAGGTQVYVDRITYDSLTSTYEGLDGVHNRDVVTKESGGVTSTSSYALQSTSNRYSSINGGSRVYDNRGNMTFDGTYYYIYDYRNRLSEVYVMEEDGASSMTSGSPATSSSTPLRSRFAVLDWSAVERAREELLESVRDDIGRTIDRNPESATMRGNLRARIQEGAVLPLSQGAGGMSYIAEPELVMVAAYVYDGFNRRTMRINFSEGVNYVTAWDGWQEVIEAHQISGANVAKKQFVWGAVLDELVSFRVENSGSWMDYFVYGDGADGASRVVDVSGTVVEKYQYDPYGRAEVYDSSDTYQGALSQIGNPFLYKAIRVDPETGLHYMRNRYYSASMGRFLSVDPIGVWGDSQNAGSAYTYVGANPLVRSDYFGEQQVTPRPWRPAVLRWGTGIINRGETDWLRRSGQLPDTRPTLPVFGEAASTEPWFPTPEDPMDDGDVDLGDHLDPLKGWAKRVWKERGLAGVSEGVPYLFCAIWDDNGGPIAEDIYTIQLLDGLRSASKNSRAMESGQRFFCDWTFGSTSFDIFSGKLVVDIAKFKFDRVGGGYGGDVGLSIGADDAYGLAGALIDGEFPEVPDLFESRADAGGNQMGFNVGLSGGVRFE